MKKVAYLVDSLAYIKQEPFQHQLFEKLKQVCDIFPIELHTIKQQNHILSNNFDLALSCLKLRTLTANINELKRFLSGVSLVVYDQDPWENYRDTSPYKGTYEMCIKNLNVDFIANTTHWWVQHGIKKGLPVKFVRMGILPRYCSTGKDFDLRPITCGFMGHLHDHRKVLVDTLEKQGVTVTLPTKTRSFGYDSFLHKLQDIKIQVHREENIVICEDKEIPFSNSMWVKDLEAMARGCFSIRNHHSDYFTYFDENIETLGLFGHNLDAKNVIDRILEMNPVLRQKKINNTVKYIQAQDNWLHTAKILVKISEGLEVIKNRWVN